MCGLTFGVPKMLIPLGISFFTFEAISCLSDVNKGVASSKISIIDIFLYLSFFATVTSGPIIRINDFLARLGNSHDEASGGVASTSVSSTPVAKFSAEYYIERILFGFYKKMLIADKLAPLADYYFDGVRGGTSFSLPGLWIGSIAYTLQLYFDFSGYSDMAIGIGGLMGFEIPENFNSPYQAGSISDFWKRWHISLSTWFRDYIYIPLGGNRRGIPRHILNMLVVWLLTGIWHGADWSFIVWGIGYLILLLLEKYVPVFRSISKTNFGNIYALFFINLLWIPFRAANMSVAGRFIAGMFGLGSDMMLEEKAIRYLPLICLACLLCAPFRKIHIANKNASLKDYLLSKKWFGVFRGFVMLLLFILALSAMINSTYTPYIYGNF